MNSKQNVPSRERKSLLQTITKQQTFRPEGYAGKETMLHMFSTGFRGWMEMYHQHSPEMSKWQVCNLFTDIFLRDLCEDV